MGIAGLLPQLKPLMNTCHISQFRGKKVAIDSYCWLHRGIYGSKFDFTDGSLTSDTWIHYCLRYIDMLLENHIQVFMVFDGCNLPCKEGTEATRVQNRRTNLEKGLEFARKGDLTNARSFLSRSVDVNPSMAAKLIGILNIHRPHVKCIVAPFEADAQLAFLSMNNIVDIVITEDSDSIPYGCHEMIFKLNNEGCCEHLSAQSFKFQSNPNFELAEFSRDMLITMAILAGCDYLASIKSMGIKTSFNLVKKYKSPEKIIQHLRYSGTIPMEKTIDSAVFDFEINFYKAYLTFKHQIVFDPVSSQVRHLSELDLASIPAHISHIIQKDLSFLGTLIDNQLATQISQGIIDPTTKVPFLLNFKEEKVVKAPSSSKLTLDMFYSKSKSKSDPPQSAPSELARESFFSPERIRLEEETSSPTEVADIYQEILDISASPQNSAQISTGAASSGSRSKYFKPRQSPVSPVSQPQQSVEDHLRIEIIDVDQIADSSKPFLEFYQIDCVDSIDNNKVEKPLVAPLQYSKHSSLGAYSGRKNKLLGGKPDPHKRQKLSQPSVGRANIFESFKLSATNPSTT